MVLLFVFGLSNYSLWRSVSVSLFFLLTVVSMHYLFLCLLVIIVNYSLVRFAVYYVGLFEHGLTCFLVFCIILFVSASCMFVCLSVCLSHAMYLFYEFFCSSLSSPFDFYYLSLSMFSCFYLSHSLIWSVFSRSFFLSYLTVSLFRSPSCFVMSLGVLYLLMSVWLIERSSKAVSPESNHYVTIVNTRLKQSDFSGSPGF